MITQNEVISGYNTASTHDLIDEIVWCKNPLSNACKLVSIKKINVGFIGSLDDMTAGAMIS